MSKEKLKNRGGSLFLFILCLIAAYCLPTEDVHALDVRRTVLPNGLTLLHVERHTLPIVSVTLLVKASPLNEPPDRAGLANLTAELITEGTKKRKSTDISEEIEFIGASLGASVDNDYTVVALSVLRKDLSMGFEIFSDVLLNPTFPEEEIRRNRELIKGSLRQSEEDPSFVATKAFKKAVFGNLPYGRLVMGDIVTLDNITREEIVSFHRQYYRPNNSVLAVVGDVTGAELNDLVGRFLADWRPSEVPARPLLHKAGEAKKTILIDRDLTQANIILGHSGISRDNPDYYAVSVMNYILGGGGFSSRLMQKVRDELGLAYDIRSYFSANKEAGLFEVGVQTKNSSANTVISEILKETKRMRSEYVTDQELDDAKAYLTGSFPRRLDTNRKIADFLVAVEFYGLGLDYVEKYPGYIRAVTREDVLRVAKRYLDTQQYTLVVVAKQGEAKIAENPEAK